MVTFFLFVIFYKKAAQGRIKSYIFDLIILVLSSSAILGNILDSSHIYNRIDQVHTCNICYRNFIDVKMNLDLYYYYYNHNLKMGWISSIDSIDNVLSPVKNVFNNENREILSKQAHNIDLWKNLHCIELENNFLSMQDSTIYEHANNLNISLGKYRRSVSDLMLAVETNNIDNYQIYFKIIFPILFSLAISISILRIVAYRRLYEELTRHNQ